MPTIDRKPIAPLNPESIVLSAIAAEPLVLAGVAYLVRSTGNIESSLTVPPADLLLAVFAAVAILAGWLSFRFAQRGMAARPVDPLTPPRPVDPNRIIAVALATVPGILGFVHYLLCGEATSLLIFNGGALAVAVWHVKSFRRT